MTDDEAKRFSEASDELAAAVERVLAVSGFDNKHNRPLIVIPPKVNDFSETPNEKAWRERVKDAEVELQRLRGREDKVLALFDAVRDYYTNPSFDKKRVIRDMVDVIESDRTSNA